MGSSLRTNWVANARNGENRETRPGWAALLTGSSLVASGLALGLSRRTWLGAGIGAGLAAGGGMLIYHGATNGSSGQERDACIAKSVTISRSPEQVYGFWKQLENLPRFMKHLHQVRRLDERRSHWVAHAPAGRKIEWDAELLEDVANRRLTWRSLPGADVDHRGSVEFKPAPGNRGTEVHVRLEYHRPGGRIGELLAMMFFEHPEQQIREDLRRFKALIEAGELPTTEGQPSGRRSVKIRTMEPFDREMLGNRQLNQRAAV
ncbi:MAG TPA: SRPBCC family protein [Terriglobales bacterium]|nr:SRPBCC family protein [Terriglobales bacterium]